MMQGALDLLRERRENADGAYLADRMVIVRSMDHPTIKATLDEMVAMRQIERIFEKCSENHGEE